ncbi:MAG: winged helix-turn-helix domain-containing protein [Alphaproteobacteria bacterium]|nr:winged helix-turn-helix domain-containing protein [Alphaproteobacteria bacterium]
MNVGPNISIIAGLVGDPARARMLGALMAGKALTASELAAIAGVALPTASAHLAKLTDGGLLTSVKQGRHRYFTLSGADVADVLESLMSLAERTLGEPVKTGPRDPRLRAARICYDHLAGDMAVALFDSFQKRALIEESRAAMRLTESGEAFFRDFGLDMDAVMAARRPACRPCLDWSARRSHLAGGLGKAILDRFLSKTWATRDHGGRAVSFTPEGLRQYRLLTGSV